MRVQRWHLVLPALLAVAVLNSYVMAVLLGFPWNFLPCFVVGLFCGEALAWVAAEEE